MLQSIYLTPEPYRSGQKGSIVRWMLRSSRGSTPVSYEVDDACQSHLVPFGRGDHVAVATLLLAMESGSAVHYHGQVSPTLLEGLEDLQRIWHRWRPARYQMVRMTADEEMEPSVSPSERRGVFAFSGGVDAMFSLFRHLAGDVGRLTVEPHAALFVKGLDIPVDQDTAFRSASGELERILEPAGIPLLKQSTDFRQMGQSWHDSSGLALASCLLLLSQSFAIGVKGSGEPYDSIVMPWGSSPLTDPLIRTASFQIRHDGAEWDRTEKVAYLVHTLPPTITDRLRVCWQGAEFDRNCGTCEKCLRTAVNFWAAGAINRTPPPLKVIPDRISDLRPRITVQMVEVINARNHGAERFGNRDPIVKSLDRAIARARLRLKLLSLVDRSLILRTSLTLIRRVRRIFGHFAAVHLRRSS